MARYLGPKNKLARAIGEDLGLKSSGLKVARRLMIRPGQHGARGRRKVSDFGLQLKEKQKLKFTYGLLERQLRKVYTEASKSLTATGATLLSLIERRLDNVVYRLKWAPTRAAARQMVSHGHVEVNAHKVNIPSYRISVGDVITLRKTGAAIPVVAERLAEYETDTVGWLEKKRGAAKVQRLPVRADITEVIEEQLIVEYYSR